LTPVPCRVPTSVGDVSISFLPYQRLKNTLRDPPLLCLTAPCPRSRDPGNPAFSSSPASHPWYSLRHLPLADFLSFAPLFCALLRCFPAIFPLRHVACCHPFFNHCLTSSLFVHRPTPFPFPPYFWTPFVHPTVGRNLFFLAYEISSFCLTLLFLCFCIWDFSSGIKRLALPPPLSFSFNPGVFLPSPTPLGW